MFFEICAFVSEPNCDAINACQYIENKKRKETYIHEEINLKAVIIKLATTTSAQKKEKKKQFDTPF